MADKAISELIAANQVTPTDLFVLEQSGTAKKLTGQILENWLVSFADGHGGIQSIVKHATSGLVDTYRITLADTTTFDFVVNNGRGISDITKTSTNGLVDTYTIKFNDNTNGTFTVTNGAKGDKGDNQYVWIKYASQKPTASSHSFGDVSDNWIGVYSGESATAPTDWTQYEWFQIKGEKGDTGEPAKLTSSTVEYQVSDSGTIIPSGAWSESVPVVAQGKYMWTRTTNSFNTGNPVVSYSVSRMGLDGSGSVSSVAGVSPDSDGNIPLTAENVGALPSAGGGMTGSINMNGQKITGLNSPSTNDEVATKGYVDTNKVDKANVVNNLTTTASGYVADARALKTLNDKFDMDLLWQNASPTSSFGGTPNVTVPINGAPYHMFLIRYKLQAGYSKYAMNICLKGDYGWLSAAMGSAGTGGSDTMLVWRELAVNANSVVFYNAMKSGKSLDNEPTEDNGWVVPYEIFGIKGGVN